MQVVNMKTVPFDTKTMVYIGRRTASDEHYGNPFGFYAGTRAVVIVDSRDESVAAYRDWLAGTRYQEIEPKRRQWVLDNLWRLRNKTLACYCAPLPCHGSVLVELLGKAA